MALTQQAVRNPAAVGVVVAIIFMFGLFALSSLPVQLFPEIELPQLSVQASWRAASPKEIESEILEPIEDVLQGLPGMQIIEANAFNGGAWVNMASVSLLSDWPDSATPVFFLPFSGGVTATSKLAGVVTVPAKYVSMGAPLSQTNIFSHDIPHVKRKAMSNCLENELPENRLSDREPHL